MGNGRMHGAPYRGHGCVLLRFGGVWLGGASLCEMEHNNNKGYGYYMILDKMPDKA